MTRLGAALAVANASGFAAVLAQSTPAAAQSSFDDALNGLLAFVVPGTDSFSVAQGLTDATPGGVDAGVFDVLIDTINQSGPSPDPQLTPAQAVSGLLDAVAENVNSNADGFAALIFEEKAAVFAYLEGEPAFAALAGSLLAVTAFLVYSEAGVFDPQTGSLTEQPLGWDLTGYDGVADGRDELVGYYRGRRKATS